METKKFVYIGQGSPVFKAGVKALFSRGVPTEVSALYYDLFEKDPLYIEVSKEEAKTMKGEDPNKVVKGLEKARKEKVAAWKKDRDAHRKSIPQPTRPMTVAPKPPTKTVGGPPKKADKKKK